MTLIHLALSLILIAVNLAAVTLLAARWLPPAPAKAVGLLLVTLPLFAFEHWLGLGSLEGFWPIVTALSLWILWRDRARCQQRDFLLAEAAFWGVFAYALLWRFFIPNIDSTSEHLANLYFIANYLPGDRLPASDYWLAGPFRFDFYYGFQHYVAALMARLFDLSPGLAMNLAQPLLIGFIGSLGAHAISCFVKSWGPRLVLLAALLIGGNGLTPLLQFFLNEPAPTAAQQADKALTQYWAATRFSGVYDERVNTREGIYFFENAAINDRTLQTMDLPYETVAFYGFLGDYHPPLGGFAILMLALALIAWLLTGAAGAPSLRSREVAIAVIAATPVLCIVTNVWSLPLQGLLVLGFAGAWFWQSRVSSAPPFEWRAFVMGALLALALVYPFLSSFAPQALNPAIKPVPPEAATRLSVWLGLHWPALVLGGFALWLGRKLRWLWLLAALLAIILAFSEWFYFDDGNVGAYLRFNTTIKFWSWTLPLVLVGIAAPVFALGGRVARTIVMLVAAALLANVVNAGRYLWFVESPQFGRLAGEGWLRADRVHGEMLTWLVNAPRGIVLEGMNGGAYNNTGAFSLFANKPMVLGWPAHEALWRRGQSGIWPLHDQIQTLYAGSLPDALGWLRQHEVRYVLWTRWDESRHPGGALRLDAQIGAQYRFRAFEIRGQTQIGVWEYRGVGD